MTPHSYHAVSLRFVNFSEMRRDPLVPLRILSTKYAARRCIAGKLGPYDIRFPATTKSRRLDTVGNLCSVVKATISDRRGMVT
jgi:hypothetical protein